MVKVDAVRIDGDWRERQSREFKALPGERKARLFHPGFLPFEIQNPKRQSQLGGISPGDDDLRWRAVDAAGHGEIACDLAPELELATRIRIEGCRARYAPGSFCAGERDDRCRYGLRRWDGEAERRLGKEGCNR